MKSRHIGTVLLGACLAAFAACEAPRTAKQAENSAASVARGTTATPTSSGYAAVSGSRFYYQVFGDLASGKTPLLILHGSYMSIDAMAPFVRAFAATRPVIALDARGHGRTGDLPGPMTYPRLADDAAGVLNALHVRRADLLGYSMGGITALELAVRHPDKVGKQVILSGTSGRDGWYPDLQKAFGQVTPAAFAGTPLESEYHRLSPTPQSFATFVGKMRDLDISDYDMSDSAIRAIGGKTMIVVGDTDGVQLEHAVKLFKLRGGADQKAAAEGYIKSPPPARLAILPATAHTGIMTNAALIAQLAVPFLDDSTPPKAPGFFKD